MPIEPRLALRELAGALGDLGTFLPLVLGALVVAGMPAAGVLTAFGVAYMLTGVAYRAPIPVQPMKVSAAVLVTAAPELDVVTSAALLLGIVFLLAWASGLVERAAQAIPRLVTAALQAGLGLSLGWLALTQLAVTPAFALGLVALLAALMAWRPGWPATLIVLALGVVLSQSLGLQPTQPLPPPEPGLPTLRAPSWDAMATASLDIVLPQIPLTLTNAILVTAAVGREYFPRARGLTEGRLALTTGLSNLLAAPLGGMPICHGAGGVAAHYRFGARTMLAPAALGLLLVLVGIGWGPSASAWLGHIPEAALGALLLVPAVELLRNARPLDFAPRERVLLAAGAGVALWSPGVAFLVVAAAVAAGPRIAHWWRGEC